MRIPSHPLHALKPHAPPVLPLYSAEAGGMAAARPQDATEGLTSLVSDQNVTWYWNPLAGSAGEWDRAHTVKSGDTLWQMTKTYYGAYSMAGVHAIHNVPQNLAIQGPSADVGLIPGDVILIPGLTQPASAPMTAPTVDLPAPDVTPPGVGMPSTTTPVPTGTVVVTPTSDPNLVVVKAPVAHPTAAPTFWTKGRIALAGGIGVVGVGTLIYLVTRPKRRSNPRRRR
jgi:hypothetical protein